jgi:hypothetical protein
MIALLIGVLLLAGAHAAVSGSRIEQS